MTQNIMGIGDSAQIVTAIGLNLNFFIKNLQIPLIPIVNFHEWNLSTKIKLSEGKKIFFQFLFVDLNKQNLNTHFFIINHTQKKSK